MLLKDYFFNPSKFLGTAICPITIEEGNENFKIGKEIYKFTELKKIEILEDNKTIMQIDKNNIDKQDISDTQFNVKFYLNNNIVDIKVNGNDCINEIVETASIILSN